MNRTIVPVTALLLLQPQAPSLSSQEAVSPRGQAEIYIMNVDGTNLRNLTNHPAQDEEPEFSPDGARILFDSDRNGNADIFVMNADGTNLVQLTGSRAKEDHGAWSPDGRLSFRRSGTDIERSTS